MLLRCRQHLPPPARSSRRVHLKQTGRASGTAACDCADWLSTLPEPHRQLRSRGPAPSVDRTLRPPASSCEPALFHRRATALKRGLLKAFGRTFIGLRLASMRPDSGLPLASNDHCRASESPQGPLAGLDELFEGPSGTKTAFERSRRGHWEADESPPQPERAGGDFRWPLGDLQLVSPRPMKVLSTVSGLREDFERSCRGH